MTAKKKGAEKAATPPPEKVEPPKPARKGMSKSECKPYVELLRERRRKLLGDMSHLEDDALRKSLQESSGDLSSVPIHMADLGSDNFEQDVTLNLMETDREELREIIDALERVDQGVYGLCETCDKDIPRARLQAIPYALLCLDCKKEEEEAAGV